LEWFGLARLGTRNERSPVGRIDKELREVEMDSEETPRRDILVEKIMHPPVSVSPDAPAREALRIMRDSKVPGVPVVGPDGQLEGFITDGHLLESALPQYMKLMESMTFVPEEADRWVHYLTEAADKPVREVMSREVSQVELGRSELAVAHRMVHDGVSSVVITKDGEVVGIVSRLDLYAAIEGID
jgi:CBS domain-containing protein